MEPKIALALGSGGARGFAHVGVLKVFEEEGIPIHMIAGSSIGALAGSVYGVGKDINRMYRLAKYFKRKYYLDFHIQKMGLIVGDRVKELIGLICYKKNIEDLDIPVAIVATDLLTGEKVIFTTGNLASAVRASISIPGIFVPEIIDDKLLVDGGLIDRIPVSVAKEMGADIVVGVDVSAIKKHPQIHSVYDVIWQSIDILQYEALQNREYASNVMLKPNVMEFDSKSFTQIEDIMKAGELEARSKMDSIRECITAWRNQL